MDTPAITQAIASRMIAEYLARYRKLPDGRWTYGSGSPTAGKWTGNIVSPNVKPPLGSTKIDDGRRGVPYPLLQHWNPGGPFCSEWQPVTGVGYFHNIYVLPGRPCWVQMFRCPDPKAAPWQSLAMVIVVDGRRDPDWPIPQVDGRGESSHMLVVDVSSESLAMWLALGCRDGKYDVGMPLARELSNLNRYTGDRKTAYDQGIDFRISDASEWSKKSRKPTAGDSCQTFDNGFLAIYADPPALVAYAGNPPQRVFAAAEHISHGFDPSIVFGVVTAIVSKIPIVGHVLAFATGWLAHQVHDSWLADENSDQDQMNKWTTLRSPVTDANGVKYDSICHATAAALASAFPVGPGASVAHPAGLGVEYALTDAQATQAALLISHGLSLTDAVARVRKDAAGAAASDPLLLAAAGAVAYGTHLI